MIEWKQVKNRFKRKKKRERINTSKSYIAALLISLSIGIIGSMTVMPSSKKESHAKEVQQGIAKEVLRFHILANSDSKEDQALKMEVKKGILEELEVLLKGSNTLKETKEILGNEEVQKQIKEKSEKIIREKGYYYSAHVELAKDYFPIKTYGDITLPPGEYEALRIQIGKAEGKNWWCVLYPNLCFVDATHAVVPEEQKEELAGILTEEEYESITQSDQYEIKFKFIEDLFKK